MYRHDRIWMQSFLLPRLERAWDAVRARSHEPWVKLVALGAALGILAFSSYLRLHLQGTVPCSADFSSDYQSALALRHGTSPYGPLADWIRANAHAGAANPFTPTSCENGILEFAYTPFFSLLLIPFTWLPYGAALALWNAGALLLLAGAIIAFMRAARMPVGVVHVVLLTTAAVLASPLRFELYFAQADIFTLFFICAALWAHSAGRIRLAAVLLAVACATEPALLMAIPFLLWKREITFAAITVLSAAAFILAPFLWLGANALRDLFVIWGFYANEHAITLTNNAPKGILLRLLTPNAFVKPLANAPGLVGPLWLLFSLAVVLAAAALIAPRPLTNDNRSLLDVGLVVAALLLVSPWSENNQFTLLIIAFLAVYVCLWRAAWRLREIRTLALGFAVAVMLFYLLGDPVQFALHARLTGDSVVRFVYELLGATYLYPLLAIAAILIYGQRVLARADAEQHPFADDAALTALFRSGAVAAALAALGGTFATLPAYVRHRAAAPIAEASRRSATERPGNGVPSVHPDQWGQSWTPRRGAPAPSGDNDSGTHWAARERYVWDLSVPYLTRIVRQLACDRDPVKQLDVVSSTGGISTAVQDLLMESASLGRCSQMIDHTQWQMSRSRLCRDDLLADPAAGDFDYDLITAFGIFRNVEAAIQTRMLQSLASRLADADSRLLFTISGNRWSMAALAPANWQLRGRGNTEQMTTYPEARRLVEGAGLEIEASTGCGLWPFRWYFGRLGPLFKHIDRWAVRARPFRWICQNMLFVCRLRAGARTVSNGSAYGREGVAQFSMVSPSLKRLVSPVLDPVGYALLMPKFADLGLAHRHGPRTEKRIAFTFDDGPVLGGTEEVLETLGDFGVPGTFFCIGANTRMHPDIIRRAYDTGHVIGAHSMNHGRTGAVSLTDTSHIDDCLRELHSVLGRTPALYRPPWGWLTPWEVGRLRRRGLEVIRWDVETPDSELPCPAGDAMFKWTLPQVRPGTILVFHDGFTHADRYAKPETVRLLRLLVPTLRDQGYEFATIPELLGIRAYQN